MTYLSVIAAASAAVFLAGSAQADPQSGLPTGQRIHKPVVAATQKATDTAHGQYAGKRQHKPLTINMTVDHVSPKLVSGALTGKRRHQPVRIHRGVGAASPNTLSESWKSESFTPAPKAPKPKKP